MLKCSPSHSALIELKTHEPFGSRVSIDQQRQSGVIEGFRPGHVDAALSNIADVEGKEVQIVVGVERVSVVFDIALDLQMLTRVEHRPGRSGQAHSTNVEILKPRAPRIENMFDPWQQALAGARISLTKKAIDDVRL